MKLEDLSNSALLDLFESFVKMWHYEATNEFDRLRELDIDYDDVREEIFRRFK
jgi:hypothetical protein